MRRIQILLIAAAVLGTSIPGYSDKASSEYKAGVRAEAKNDFDAAYEAYKSAHSLNAHDPKYLAAYARLRFYAAAQHVHTGQTLLQQGKLNEALAEFQKGMAIDPANFVAQQGARQTAEMIKKAERQEKPTKPESPLAKLAEQVEGPVELKALSTTPINLRMSENADMIYKVIGKLAGVNVLIDSEYRPQRINVELNDVTPREALDMVGLQSKTFWQPVSANTIFVAADTASKRKDLQGNVMKTFYLKNVATPAELQEAASTIKGILDLNRVQLVPNQNAMIVRGTTDQLILAEKLLNDIDKAKAEVVIDIAVMQVSRDHLQNMGVSPPTSGSITLIPPGGVAGGASGGTLTLNTFSKLNGNNFAVSIPSATVTALMSDSDTKLLQNPEIRALDNEKATLKIGDRVPVATGSFQSGIGIGSVNTQFQYLDVGVNIDIVPHIHSENEVTLKMVLEISSVTGQQNIGGVSQPIIGQRRIEHETRLQDGEVNLVGGILEDSEVQSLSGYPYLAKIPILKYLFAQTDKQRHENEIVFAITPHILRAQDLTDQNLRMVDIGTGNSIELRHSDVRASNANGSSTQASALAHPKNTRPAASNIPVVAPVVAPVSLPARPVPTSEPNPANTGSVPSAQNQPPTETGPAVLNSPSSPAASGTAVAATHTPVYPTRVAAAQNRPNIPANVPANTIASTPPPVTAPRVASAAPPPTSSPVTLSAAQESPAAATRRARPVPTKVSAKELADPCPFGQHSIEVKKNVVICAFD